MSSVAYTSQREIQNYADRREEAGNVRDGQNNKENLAVLNRARPVSHILDHNE